MADNEDLKRANAGAPAADIPDLKKKEKERKKAGVGWGGAKPGGAPYSGAAGSATIARAAASAAGAGSVGAGAAGAAGAVGTVSALLAGLRATALGKALFAAGAAVFLLGAGIFGYSLLKGGAVGDISVGDLGALSSSMKVRAGGGDRLGYGAGQGEIVFDPVSAQSNKEEKPAQEKPDAQAEEQTADAAGPPSDWSQPRLDYNLSGAKLTSSLGGSFGAKNIFSGSSGAPKFNDSSAKVNIPGAQKINIPGAQKGKLTAMRRGQTRRVSRGAARSRLTANKAFGQLRVAKGLSTQGAGTTVAEGARATATSAFEGQTGNGDVKNVEGEPGTSPGGVTPPGLGGGAPDVTLPDVATPFGTAVDQATAEALAAIAAVAKQAGELKKMGTMMMMFGGLLMVAGGVLIAIGLQMGPLLGAVLITLGVVMVTLGTMLLALGLLMNQLGGMLKGLADSMSSQLSALSGDIKQDAINKYCIAKAYVDGIDPKDCDPPDSVTQGQSFDASEKRAVGENKTMVKETGQVQGAGGSPPNQ